VRIGLQIGDFACEGGPARLGPALAEVSRAAEDAGFSHLALMDHFFQIRHTGSVEDDMLEAYTALAFMAAHTSTIQLGTLVTGVVYRHPGVLAKTMSTLDVLSGGRTWLGLGAAWMEEEATALGIPFPPLAERFGRLEEAVQIILQMWAGDESPYAGRYYRLERPLNHPQPLTRPHPPLMIGGSGEKKTLPMVAKYAQACNIFPSPAMPRKLEVLREHCERLGRDYDAIEKTTFVPFDIGERGEKAGKLVDTLGRFAALGFDTVYGTVPRLWDVTPLEILGKEVIPAVAAL
jgi:F420-dependent oxidoreductase-like protein